MKPGKRSRAAAVAALLAVASGAPWGAADAPAADALTPPGRDGFSEHALTGIRLGVGPRSAAAAPDGTVHVVYGDTVLRHAWNDGSGWSRETLDATHARGAEPSLAIGGDGSLHVAYYDPRTDTLFHGTDATGEFVVRTVASGGGQYGRSAIAAADGGVVSVAWVDGTGVRFADDASGTFSATTLATDAKYTKDVDLALDAAGEPHVVYMSAGVPAPPTPGFGPRALVHLARTETGWMREDVEKTDGSLFEQVGQAPSLAFAPDGALHVAYRGRPPGYGAAAPLRHGVRTEEGWTLESVGTVDATYIDRSRVVVDAAGEPHVATWQWKSGAYHRRESGEWTTTQVGGGTAGTALALDGADVHVAWSDAAGVYVATSESGGDFSETTLEFSSEPLVRASVAVASDGAPRMAVVRAESGDLHLDVVRRSGDAWSVERVASGVAGATAPSLRADPSDALHVAYATTDGRIRCATDSSGTWEPEDVATGVAPVTYSGAVGLAIAPDGTRRVVYGDAATRDVRVAQETAEGWTSTTVGSGAWTEFDCDVEVGADGAAHAAWCMYSSLVSYATDRTGVWIAEQLIDGSGYPVSGPDVAIDPAGDVHVAIDLQWQFGAITSVWRRTGDGWDADGTSLGGRPFLGFLPDGSPLLAAAPSGVSLAERDGTTWRRRDLDGGPAALRSFGSGGAAAVVTEGAGAAFVAIRAHPAGTTSSRRVERLGATFDAAGAVHAAYVDPRTGDLRYVTNRAPAETGASIDVEVTWGTASPADVSVTPARVRYRGADDSGSKNVELVAPADLTLEGDETLTLTLSNPVGGLVLDPALSARVVTVADEAFPPAPPPPPPPPFEEQDDGAYFLPLRAERTPSRSYAVSGVLHLGTARIDPTAGVRIDASDAVFDFGTVRLRRGGWWSARSGGARLSLRPDRRRPSILKFALSIPRGAAEPDLVSPAEFSFRCGDFEAASVVHPESRRVDLARGIGAFTDPELHLVGLDATSGDEGTVALTAYVAGLGAVPSVPVPLRLALEPGFEIDVPASAVRIEGDSVLASAPGAEIAIDFGRRSLRARLHGLAVQSLEDGERTADVRIGIGALERTLRTRVTSRRGRIRG